MNFFNNVSINNRLLIGFSITTLLMIILTTVGIYRVNMIGSSLTTMTEINVVKQRNAINFRGSVHDRAIAIRDLATSSTPAEANIHINNINELAEFYQVSQKKMEDMKVSGVEFSPEENSILQQLEEIQQKTEALIVNIINTQSGMPNNDGLMLLKNGGSELFVQWLSTINSFIDLEENKNIITTKDILENASTFKTTMLVLTVSALALSILIAYLIANSFKSSLGAEPKVAAEALSQIAQGNLVQPFVTPCENSMMCTMSKMQERLRHTILEISSASNDLKIQSTVVTEGSKDIILLANKQDELTVSTSESLNDIQANITEIAETASQNRTNAQSMVERANNGLESMSLSVDAMQSVADIVTQAVEQISKLEALTDQIGGITNVINGISDQTNLLALNAAIEAARAGETGRGFAVVADEVRQLALRTGEATSEIQSTIEEVQQETSTAVTVMQNTLPKVEDGQAKTQDAMSLLQDIGNNANNSFKNAGLVSATATEQVVNINSINDVMEQIEGISKETVHSLEQNNTATLALDELAEKLNKEVGYFKVS